jgi:hypothetical protein
MKTQESAKPMIATSKKGLTKPGVAVIQTLLIGLVAFIEITLRHGVGVFTGLAICLATLGTVRFGRTGTAYVAAATAPLAFAVVTMLIFLKDDGLHPSKLGVDFVASLASAAPYLLISAAYGWLNCFRSRTPKTNEKA